MCGRILLCIWMALACCSAEVAYVPSIALPPEPPREFRGAWVATVNNIDWPSQPGLSTSQQQQELIALLDRAAALRLNAILFQVRPACDALYESRHEPWSEYLSGKMGEAPHPFYDPLAMAIREAHQRGLELHAWFNPFRARHHSALGPMVSHHISRTRPQWVRSYGRYLWLDPSEPGVQDYSLKVIMDVVKRYDVDGVHIDDYFYPYKEKDARGRSIDFPDATNWKRYQLKDGRLSRDDWRREQVNQFVQKLYRAVKEEKPHVKVGISPFGIWRPGYPPGVDGLDAYQELYADALKWWRQGWLDYLAPQLYWSTDAPRQSFPALLDWWGGQNPLRRHLWPGLNTANVGTKYHPDEILKQIQTTRSRLDADGQIHWSIKVLMQNRMNLGDSLVSGPYSSLAVPPAFTWIDHSAPLRPALSAGKQRNTGKLAFTWDSRGGERPSRWLLEYHHQGHWHSSVHPAHVRAASFQVDPPPEWVSVRGMDRCLNIGPATVIQRTSVPAKAAK